MNISLSVVFAFLFATCFANVAFSQTTNEEKMVDGNMALRSYGENINDLPFSESVEIYYYFEINDNFVSDPAAKIKINPEVPEGLIYRIQVAVFRNPVSPQFFKGITPVHAFSSEGTDVNKYYVGMFRRLSDAKNALTEVKEIGFKDSFITSFFGSKPVPPDQAVILENEWGKKPFERIEKEKPAAITKDTIAQSRPQELPVKEEVMSVPQPVETKDTLRKDALKLFIDCRSCDLNYTRQEVPFVNYVRDTREAEVYLLINNEGTGSGGTRFTFSFQGLGKYAGMNDTIIYTSNPDETGAIIREKKTHMIKMGLMRYVARTPLFDEVVIKNNGEKKQTETDDKWNNWVFMLQTSPQFNAEETYNRISLYNSFEVSRVTPEFKLESEISYFNNRQKFIEDEVVSEYLIKSRSMQNLFVKSMGEHWSGGLRFDMESSTSMNYDFNVDVLPTIEYDIYPYSEATHRQFRIMYSIGYEYSNYTDTTIYNKIEDGLFKHSLRAAYQIQKKWGSINLSASGSNYLDDFSKNRFGFWGYTRLRIIKGLSLSLNAGVTYVNNQLNLAMGDISEAERLLRLKQQATSFYLNGGISLSYTFGSIYNNVVNPRFGNNQGNTYY
jgi:hypothetical protein